SLMLCRLPLDLTHPVIPPPSLRLSHFSYHYFFPYFRSLRLEKERHVRTKYSAVAGWCTVISNRFLRTEIDGNNIPRPLAMSVDNTSPDRISLFISCRFQQLMNLFWISRIRHHRLVLADLAFCLIFI
ncbi:hypothetical protein M8C21_000208, partial [Ambrosia artemisiifolia]